MREEIPAPVPSSIPMTRHTLENNLLKQYLRRMFPDIYLLNDDELRASIRHLLETCPNEAREQCGLYLFAYGSLIWNPCVPVDERLTSRLYGFHRDFCLKLTHGRGSEECPGLMLALIPGGSCRGVAIHLPKENLENELLLIWRREMLTNAYRARWVRLSTLGGPVWAIAFVANTSHERFVSGLAEEEVISLLSTGHGVLGSCREYLHNTVNDLHSLAIRDRKLEGLAHRVAKIC